EADHRQTIFDRLPFPRRTRLVWVVVDPRRRSERLECSTSCNDSFILVRALEHVRLDEELSPHDENPRKLLQKSVLKDQTLLVAFFPPRIGEMKIRHTQRATLEPR